MHGRTVLPLLKDYPVVALPGHVLNSGVVEVPMGTPLRTIVFDIGGGVPDGKAPKAIYLRGFTAP